MPSWKRCASRWRAFRRRTRKQQNQQSRSFTAADLTEAETRQKIIDIDLKAMGWKFTGPDADVRTEYEVDNMNGVLGQKGYADYVLMGKDGLPLAVIEAKRSTKDPNIGRKQAQLYANCLEQKFGRRPMLFTTNGYTTYFWMSRAAAACCERGVLQGRLAEADEPPHREKAAGHHCNRRQNHRPLLPEKRHPGCLRPHRAGLPAQSAGHGDRHRQDPHRVQPDRCAEPGRSCDQRALSGGPHCAGQAGEGRLQKVSAGPVAVQSVLLKDDKAARIVFSTYPTMLNAIDNAKTKDGVPLFSPAHFDLIIVDESHRSIFKKYRAIFDYFDAILVGLTATPENRRGPQHLRLFRDGARYPHLRLRLRHGGLHRPCAGALLQLRGQDEIHRRGHPLRPAFTGG